MPRGEKLFRFLAGLMLQRFFGTVTIRFKAGKVIHVEAHTQQTWQYRDLSDICPSDDLQGRVYGFP